MDRVDYGEIGEGFIRKDLKNGSIIYHKKRHEYLAYPSGWKRIKTDWLANHRAKLYAVDNCLFVEREITLEVIKESFKKLCQLSEKEFDKVGFEEVIGVGEAIKGDPDYILGPDDDRYYHLYHSYSEGVALNRLTQKTPVNSRENVMRERPLYEINPPTPKVISSEIENILAKGIRELHKSGVLYQDPLPTFSYLRYSFGNKILYSPHNCMKFSRPLNKDIGKELAIILYTHDYIDNKRNFLKRYLGIKIREKSLDKFIDETDISLWLRHMEDGEDIPISYSWAGMRNMQEFIAEDL